MKISQCVKEYTAGEPIKLGDVFSEINEFFVELAKFNKDGVKEEIGDIFIFLQLWLYWRFGMDEEI